MTKHKFFTTFIVIIAIITAILETTMPESAMRNLFLFTNFFRLMIPILGAGALIKYLCLKDNNE